MSGQNNWEYKRGHKPKGSGSTPPRTALAKRQKPIVIDAVIEDEADSEDATEYIDCQISVPQLDTIYNLLQPRQKAMAVLNALTEEA